MCGAKTVFTEIDIWPLTNIPHFNWRYEHICIQIKQHAWTVHHQPPFLRQTKSKRLRQDKDINVSRCSTFDWVLTCCSINNLIYYFPVKIKSDLIIGQKAAEIATRIIFHLVHLKTTKSMITKPGIEIGNKMFSVLEGTLNAVQHIF